MTDAPTELRPHAYRLAALSAIGLVLAVVGGFLPDSIIPAYVSVLMVVAAVGGLVAAAAIVIAFRRPRKD